MADSEVIRLLRSFKADLLRQERAQMEAMAARWLNVERRLHGQMDALAMEMVGIKRDGGTVSPELLMTQQRYRELLTQLQQEMEPYSDYVERTITDRQRQLARLGIKHAERAITSQGVAGGFNRLPVEAVENLAGFAANGTPLNNLLMMTWPDAAIGLTQELVNGIALGRNPRQVARMMANGATGSLDRMMVIARTEQLRAYRTANLDSYRASGVVNGYKRLATHDSRVCAACLMDEGTFYTLDEEMPEHPQGRCTLVPVVDGMPEPKWKQGQAWFEEQDAATQKDILGKGRYYAWQNGDFDLGELVTVKPNAVWGDSLQTTTLHDLLGGRAVAPQVVRDTMRNVILEADGPLAQQHLSDYGRIPEALRNTMADKGVSVYINNDRTMPDIDDLAQYRNVRPRGWPEGMTWNDVPGVYHTAGKAVVAGKGEHGTSSLLLHEYGHAVGDVLGYDNDTRLIALHKAQHGFLDPYLQQGGPGAFAGRQEFLAESFAQVLIDSGRAKAKYGLDMVEFIENVVLKGEKAILQ